MSPLVAFHCPGKPWDWKNIDDCRKCQAPCFGSLDWVEVIWAESFADGDHYHNDPMVVSVTTALGCLRKAYLQRTVDHAEEPKKLLARVTGTHMHRLAEKHSPDGAEVEFSMVLSRGYTLKGTADKSLPGIVKDWKTCDRVTKGIGGALRIKEDGSKVHINCEQLSVYADLKEQVMGEEDVEVLEIVQVARKDVAVREAYRVPNALEFVVNRAELLIDALEKGENFLPKEGADIKFYRSSMCSFCAVRAQCEQGD